MFYEVSDDFHLAEFTAPFKVHHLNHFKLNQNYLRYQEYVEMCVVALGQLLLLRGSNLLDATISGIFSRTGFFIDDATKHLLP